MPEPNGYQSLSLDLLLVYRVPLRAASTSGLSGCAVGVSGGNQGRTRRGMMRGLE